MNIQQFIGLVATVLSFGTMAPAEEASQVRVAVLEIGTVNWELSTIKMNDFDKDHGFELVVQGYAGNDATRIAFAGGEADVVVADWIWAARQRAAGKDYVFFPYSKIVGGLMVPADSDAQTLADLAGTQIGIAGGPVDKSWLILRAYAQQEYGMDLAAETEQVFGAPPLIFKSALDGELGGAINFWHFLAKMKAANMRQLISVSDAAQALGLDPDTPLLGYVFKESFVSEHPDLVRAFVGAARDAKDLLATDDEAWDAIRSKMNAKSDEQFNALRADFRSGIPAMEPINEEEIDKFLHLMADLGGEKLVGQATSLPAGLFLNLN